MTRFRKWTALLLAGTLLLTGCTSVTESKNSGQQSDMEQGNVAETAETEKSMGRYLEKEIAVPDEVASMSNFPVVYMQKLDTGELLLAEQFAGMYISGDNGETWERKDVPWLDELKRNYISQIALAPNGAAAVIYSPLSDEEENEDKEISQTAAEEALGDTESDYEADKYRPQYLYADQEGNTKAIEYQDTDGYLQQFWFGKDSRLYAYGINYEVYEVNTEDGSMKELFETDGITDYVCFTEKYMIAFTSRQVAVYDLETGMLTDEDSVFSDFIMDNLGGMIGSITDAHSVVAVEGEQEDVIYFAFSGGLYRHVIGGTTMEQIVDGSISSFGDPMMSLAGMAVLPDNEFVVLYGGVKLYRYVYDPDVPTVPEEQLNVYSLTDNYVIRQAVSLFQKQNPDVYVRYEIGMTGDDGLTAEDAIKSLNTKIMSGSGPDLLVLDGLPAESYKEKGILADISTLVDNMTGEDSLFPNLVEACREDGKLYGLPVRFQLPMAAGKREDVRKAADLSSLADVAEKLREENPEGWLLGLRTEEEVIYALGQTSSAAWTDETGAIDREALTEFLTNARRIYQAEIAGVDEQEQEDYREGSQTVWSGGFAGEGKYYATASTNAVQIAMGAQKFAVGRVYRLDFDFNMLTTLKDQEEDFTYASWQGQVPNGFIPNTTVGLYAKSMENELAVAFFRFLFGRELQDVDLSGGFPMNMASFDTFAECPRGEEYSGGLAMSDEDGNFYSLDLHWADAEDFAWLKETVQAASQICTGDATIERAVLELGPKALNGKASVEDTVDEIIKKVSIYLAE